MPDYGHVSEFWSGSPSMTSGVEVLPPSTKYGIHTETDVDNTSAAPLHSVVTSTPGITRGNIGKAASEDASAY